MHNYAHRMMELFRGSLECHGTVLKLLPGAPGEKVRPASKSIFTSPGPPTMDLWGQHLSGDLGLGVVPATTAGLSYFGAVDVDRYNMDMRAFLVSFSRLGTMGVPVLSKSGGVHLYFFTSGIDTVDFARYLNHIADLMGLPKGEKREIFPKQDRVGGDKKGNWINMPYFGDSRWAISADGRKLPIAEFLDLTAHKTITPQQLADDGARLCLGGPKCLIEVMTGGKEIGPGERHHYRLAYASFVYNTRHSDPRSAVEWFTEEYTPGQYTDDMEGIAKSVEKTEYRFKCALGKCTQSCGKEQTKAIEMPSELDANVRVVRYDTSPPIYTLMYPGAPDVVISVDEMVSAVAMKKRFIAAWGRMPDMPSGRNYNKLINKWLSNVEVVAPPPASSADGQLKELLEGYCRSARSGEPSTRRSWVEGCRHVFTLQGLLAHLDQMRFRDLERHQVSFALHAMGADPRTVVIGPRMHSAFSLPLYQGFELSEPTAVPSDVV